MLPEVETGRNLNVGVFGEVKPHLNLTFVAVFVEMAKVIVTKEREALWRDSDVGGVSQVKLSLFSSSLQTVKKFARGR